MLQAILVLNIILQIALFILSYRRLKQPQFQTITNPLMFIFGAFVWEDMFVLSIFWFIGSLILLYLNSLNATIIFVLLFIALREYYETIYWIFQQFHQTAHRPYDFGFKNLNNNSIYILYQVFSFSLATLSLFFLIIYLSNL